MKTSTRFLLAMTVWTAGGCEWIAGIEDTTVARDAGPDARVDEPRDGGSTMDGGPVDDCPGPGCVGDAVAEFATNQDGPWRYTEDYFLLGFLEMRFDASGAPPAWSGQAQNPSSIVNCAQHAEAVECSGLGDRLLLQPSADAAAPRPALVWIAPETGTYGLAIDWRLDDTQPDEVPAEVLVARNNGFDRVLTAAFDVSTEVGTFPQGNMVEIDAVRGDSLALVLAGTTRTALGVRFHVSDLQRNDHCRIAISLEGPDSFPNECEEGAQFAESGSQATFAANPLPGIPGVARTFSRNSLLRYQGDVNDYDGDWTMQFWARFDGAGEVLSDLSCTTDGTSTVAGGLSVTFDGDDVIVRAFDEILHSDCTELPHEVLVPRDPNFVPEDWHFYRIVRDQAGSALTVCVDGLGVDTMTIPSEATMATDRRLEIGNRVDTTEEASFEGHIADLRMYDRALPCLPSPP